MTEIVLYITIMILSYGLTQLCIKLNPLDIPLANRSSHSHPIPTSGGIGFIIACFVGILFLNPVHDFNITHYPLILILTSSIVAIVGFLDDRQDMNFLIRLIIQLGICCFLIVNFKTTTHHFNYYIIIITLTVFFSGFINAINFCDGLNGLLGTGTVLVCCTLSYIHPNFSHYLFSLAFALLGFLLLNWQGKIFMGDVGSSFIGFFIPAILLIDQDNLLINILSVGHLMFIYLFDISATVFMKIKNNETIFIPHRDFHFHILNKLGLNHITITLIYGFFTIIQAVILIYAHINTIQNWAYFYVIDFFLYFSLFKVVRDLYKKMKNLETKESL